MKTEQASYVGQTFNEMYRIIRPIGTGGMGAVFEAVHTRLAHKKFAVKMLHASIAQDAEVFQRFRREAEIATELGHPNIVEVHDFNITPDGAPYMVMEYLEGEDLAARLVKRGPASLDIMARIISEVCSGLDAAHNAGIVHRDLKPQNIFLCKKLGRDDFVKLVDFGISKVKDSSSVVTRDHSLMGTPFYMSPEQADGLVQQIDSRTDIFALGAIMWEMLTGRMAFEAPTISGAMYKVVHVDPAEVHLLRPDVPPAVSLVLRRAMAKHKDYRYAHVMELSHEFGAALRGIPPSVMPPPMSAIAATLAPPVNMPPPSTPPLATPAGYGSQPPGSYPPTPGTPAGWGSQQGHGGPIGSQPPAHAALPATTPPQGWAGSAPPLNTPYPRPATPGPAQGQPSAPGMAPPHAPTPIPATRAPSARPDPAASSSVPMAPQSKPKTGLFIGIGVGVVAVGVGLVLVLGMGKKDTHGAGSGSADAGHEAVIASAGADAGTVTNTDPPDAGSGAGAVVVTRGDPGNGSGSGSTIAEPDMRAFAVVIAYDSPPRQPAPIVKLNGEVVDGLQFRLPPGEVGKLEISEKGYSTFRMTVTGKQAAGDLPVKLKKKPDQHIWLPQ